MKKAKPPALGLSAVQINIPVRLFAVQIPEHPALKSDIERLVENLQDGWNEIIVNPEILWYGKDKVIENEMCLSIPGIELPIERSWQIEVKYTDLHDNPHHEHLTGLHARVFQHEFDHLEGKLITDYGKTTVRSETNTAI